jgi:hypothetical protein
MKFNKLDLTGSSKWPPAFATFLFGLLFNPVTLSSLQIAQPEDHTYMQAVGYSATEWFSNKEAWQLSVTVQR